MKTKSTERGVTLIELMTVVAIIAILGTIAVSSYRNSTMRSHRAEAKIALMTIKVEQEKFFLQNRQYAATTAALNVPGTTGHGYYTIGLTTANTNSAYTATATAAGGQQDDKDCYVYTVKSDGSQSATTGPTGPTDNSTNCWK